MRPTRLAIVLCCCLVACAIFAGPARGHETDQFTTPIGREFADLGPFFNQWAYDLIDQGVRQTNSQIRHCIEQGANASEMAHVEAPDRLVDNVHKSLPWSVHQIEAFERLFLSPQMRQRYPGRIVSYREMDHNIYEHAFTPFDYRVFSRWFFASTIKVYGVYFGTDKIGHFTDMGIAYYWAWQQARAHGASEEQALAAAVRLGTEGPSSEAGWLGLQANGDYANGDLAANYLGFLFYRNIAEPTLVKGSLRPPMVVREGMYWRMADFVRRDSDFFAMFISDHLDEALNPGFFDESMRPGLREAVKDRANATLWRYRDDSGSIRSRQYFERKLAELSTYWGADYGHRGKPDELVSIANCCFGAANENVLAQKRGDVTNRMQEISSVALMPDEELAEVASARIGDGGDLLPPLAASRTKNASIANVRVQSLLIREAASGETRSRDEFGRTPLHDAAAAGSAKKLQMLLDEGADPNTADDYGTTALHLACRNGHEAVAQLLLNKGARMNAVNAAGSTPLHEAASSGDSQLVSLLLEHGAVPDMRDRRGRVPADIAAARGYPQIVATLRNAGNAPTIHNPSDHEAFASSK